MMRVIAEPFSHWIPPNVAGNILDYLFRAQDVIVVALLPQSRPTFLTEFVGCALLEQVDESDQIGSLGKSLTEEMNVVWHDAVGVEREFVLHRQFQKMIEQPPRCRLSGKERDTVLCSNGHEKDSAATILV